MNAMNAGLCATVGFLAAAAGIMALPVEVESTRAPDWNFSVGADAGWRQDRFEWTIAGDLGGGRPNILSDLDWRGLDIVTAAGVGEVTFRQDWHLRLKGGYGWIVGGRSRDSDYDLNDRRGEFSRSTADTRGGVVDVDAVLAHDFKVSPRVMLSPGVGFTYHRMRLKDRNGDQVIDTDFHDLGPFPGLDDVYAANWWGAAFVLDARVQLAEKWRWLAGLRYELLQYHAIAEWNLRSDIVNFRDTANGQGWVFTTGVSWDVAPGWTLSLLGDFGRRTTRAGVDDTLLNGGVHVLTRFNQAVWESAGVRGMATYHF